MAFKIDESFQIPPGPFIGLLGRKESTDVHIELPINVGTFGTFGTPHSKEIYTHSAVLLHGSSYFKGLLTTGAQMADPAEKKPATNDKVVHSSISSTKEEHGTSEHDDDENDDAISADQTLVVTQRLRPYYEIRMPHMSSQEAEAYQSVIHFLYTHKLPDSLPVSALCEIMLVANYLCAEVCLQACAQAIEKLAFPIACLPEDWNTVITFSKHLGISQELKDCLYTRLKKFTRACFGDIKHVLEYQSEGICSFNRLPFPAIEFLVKQDTLLVYSEDSVVVLISRWWQHQTDNTFMFPSFYNSQELASKLSELIRIDRLSFTYRDHVISNLPWFRPPSDSYRLECHLMNSQKWSEQQKAACHYKSAHARTSDYWHFLRLDMRVDKAQLIQLVESGTPVAGVERYWQGFYWKLNIAWDPEEEIFQVILTPTLPSPLDCTLLCVSADVSIYRDISMTSKSYTRIIFKGDGCVHMWKSQKVTNMDVITALKPFLTSDQSSICLSIRDVI